MRIAVITGASSGIGREFVRVIAEKEQLDEIWVIARRADRLAELAKEIKTPIRALALDLTLPESYDEYSRELKASQPDVAILINASGYGYFGEFEKRPLKGQLQMIDLNDKAVVALCYLTLPYMNRGGEIYNIASTSSFQPVPFISVYAGTKALVMSFSRALNMELKPRGIRVMAVCPHWCKTEFFDTAVTDDTIKYYNFFNIPRKVAQTAVKNMKRGRDVSLCGARIKLQVLAVKLLPHKMVMKTWMKQQDKPMK